VRGRLCVFAIDLRGGLGLGASYTNVLVDGVLCTEPVRVIGAADLLSTCARRDAEHRSEVSGMYLSPRGPENTPDFSSWRKRLAFAVRRDIVSHIRGVWGRAAPRVARFFWVRRIRVPCGSGHAAAQRA
jgi:hypothetical protein